MLILTSFLLVLSLAHQTRSQQCGAFTTRDVEGPFFIANADLNYAIAPSNEIGDSGEGVILRGQVCLLIFIEYVTKSSQVSNLCKHLSIQR